MLTDIIEALLFARGDQMPINELYEGLKESYSKKEIDKALKSLKETYCEDRGIILIQVNDSYQFQTNPSYGELLKNLLQQTKERELSKTLLQVLAIIAYKHPITKQEIEDLRGLNSDYVIAALLRFNLIEAVGRKDTLGHPILYATTDEFLKKFGLTSLSELPDYDELIYKIQNNFDKYFAKSDSLYRNRTISDGETEGEGAPADNADLQAEVAAAEDDEDENELPDFLSGEDIIEVD